MHLTGEHRWELPPCLLCALTKAKRSSFSKPITIPDQIGGQIFFEDVQEPFELESLGGSVCKISIIEAKTRFHWIDGYGDAPTLWTS